MIAPRKLLCCLALLSAGCTYLTPYKLEIQQGHVLDDAGIAKLKAGMSKTQVSQVLGTPLLTDVFHQNRWDYVHYLRKRGRMTAEKKLTLIFEDEKLARLEGAGVAQLAPAEKPPAATPEDTPRMREPPPETKQ
jgi:outer membrane protein assembly factor BamE